MPRDRAPDPTSDDALLEAFLETTADNVYFKDLEGRFVKVSPTQARWLGHEDAAEVIGKTDFDFFSQEHAERALADEEQIIRTGEPIVGIEERDMWRDGRTAWVSTTKVPLRDQTGTIVGTFGISRDITEHKLAELAAERQQGRMAAIIETHRNVAAGDGSLNANLVLVARGAQQLALARGAALLLFDGSDLVLRAGSGPFAGHRGLRLGSTTGPLGTAASGTPIARATLGPDEVPLPGVAGRSFAAVPIRHAARIVGVLCVAAGDSSSFDRLDLESLQLLTLVVTAAVGQEELRRQATLHQYQALHDDLTGLPNRTLFSDRVRQALLAADREGSRVAVALMDLNRFKEINDTLGHPSGDRVLEEVARRLQASIRASDTVARIGGDEFGLLLPNQKDAEETSHLLDRLTASVEPVVDLDGLPLAVEASIGVAFYPQHGLDVDGLIKRADVALYVAKQQERPYAVYEQKDDAHEPIRLTLIGELRRALDQHDLRLHYQPKASLADGRVRSVEALLRWYHPDRGLIEPGDFIPAAQQTGLMKPLTLYVLDEALRQLHAWAGEGIEVAVSVNLAGRNLMDVTFPDDVAAALERWQIEPQWLELEITESTMLDDRPRITAVLERLDRLGVGLSIDDFGTGYSSLGYLHRLPVSEIKIDRSFVLGMTNDPNDEVIVRATIELGRNLGLRVVAEGVETAEVWERLEELGCDVAQGFYLARPMPADELASWLTDRR